MTAAADAYHRDVLPVCLMLRGRPCLVVGGGKVAWHKVRLLLDAQADVTVVSPEADRELLRAAETGAVQHLARAFADTDADGAFLAFAATNDKAVNRVVVDACRARGVLCCSADGNWTAGDFVTPATYRKDGLTVAVSTGGRSCRRARLVKENLKRHLDLAVSADLLVMGTSHEQLRLDRREALHLIGRRLDATGQMVARVWGVHEFLLLNTCNRVELHAMASGVEAVSPLIARILGFDRLSPGEFYVKQGFEAFQHVAEVAAGLRSQTPGEYHIVSQVKDALDCGTRAGWAQATMQAWVAHALHVSKDIRAVSAPWLQAADIEDVAARYLDGVCPTLGRLRTLVLGTGTVGLGVVARLLERVASLDLCYHLRRPELPEAWRARVRLGTFDDLRARLGEADVVVCATDSPHHVLLAEHLPCFGGSRPVQILDLTLPRNVDPELDGRRPGLKVADLEVLKHWHRQAHVDVARLLAIGRETVRAHADLYEKIRGTFLGPATEAAVVGAAG